jgi:transcription initiation factor TFIIIB Brf1 subunit/transcription initiation factor TFIIB
MLFDQFLNVYSNIITDKNSTKEQLCKHLIKDNENNICLDCGEELTENIICDKEWRYYQSNNSIQQKNPTRVQQRKIQEKNIIKDIQHMGFNPEIIKKANSLYEEVTNGKIFRGVNRKSIVFACVFYAFQQTHNEYIPHNLNEIFGISNKNGLRGMKIVNNNYKCEINKKITPIHIINNIMIDFGCNFQQKKEVVLIYKKIKNKSSKLNRARPHSIASSIVYYWISKNGNKISLKEYSKKVNLSELTIIKNIKEIDLILST